MKQESVKTLDELIRSRGFETFLDRKTGNDMYLSDPERRTRMDEASVDGMEGSLHCEIIQDWEEYLATLTVSARTRKSIQAEIETIRKWHRYNGSLYKQVG